MVDNYNFNGPLSFSELEQNSYTFTVWYCAKNLAIEFTLEKNTRFIDCYIAKLVDGERPGGYLLDENGNRVRFEIASWVRNNGINTPLFTNVAKLNFEESTKIILKCYANMLKEYGNAILNDSRWCNILSVKC